MMVFFLLFCFLFMLIFLVMAGLFCEVRQYSRTRRNLGSCEEWVEGRLERKRKVEGRLDLISQQT